MAEIKSIKNTVSDAFQKGLDIIEGGTKQVAGVFGKINPIEQYRSDIQLQAGVDATKKILNTTVGIFENEAIENKDKIDLLQYAIEKTKSSCVKYRARFYQSLLLLENADSFGERELYLAAIDGFTQSVGEYHRRSEIFIEEDTVDQNWLQNLSEAFQLMGKEISENLHSLTAGLIGSDEEDSEKELTKSFRESSTHSIDNVEVDEHICVSFCHYWIAYCYEKIEQTEEARLWYIRALSSKSAIIRDRAKGGYFRMNALYSQSFVDKSPAVRASIILFQSLEAMAGFNDPLRTIIPFDIEGIPARLSFSTNRPKAGILYQVHPCRDFHYVEYERYDRVIFDEQISEFLRLCQGIGADSVEFKVIEGKLIETDELSELALGLDISIEDEKGGGAFKTTNKSDSQTQGDSVNSRKIKLGYVKRVSVPTDLVWEGKEGWRDGNELIKNFRSGIRLIDFTAHFKTSSYNKEHLASDVNLKASYSKMKLTLSGSINQSEDTTFVQEEKREWSLHVHFAKRGFAGFLERFLAFFVKLKAGR